MGTFNFYLFLIIKMTYDQIINKVAGELNLPEELVRKTYKAYWQFIRDTIQLLPLKEDISDEEFLKLNTNFNIPSLGKLTCTIDRYKGMKSRFKYIKNLRK